MDCSTPGFPALHYLLEFAQTHVTESVMPLNHLILCHPLLFLSSVFPSIRVFSNESTLCILWLRYWSFSFITSPSNDYLRLISFRIDWFALLVIQGTLKSVLQHHSSKASILRHPAFFIVQLWHPCMTAGKTIALTSLHLEQILFSDQLMVLWTCLLFLTCMFLPKLFWPLRIPSCPFQSSQKNAVWSLRPISMALVPGPEVASSTFHHSYPLTSIHSFPNLLFKIVSISFHSLS